MTPFDWSAARARRESVATPASVSKRGSLRRLNSLIVLGMIGSLMGALGPLSGAHAAVDYGDEAPTGQHAVVLSSADGGLVSESEAGGVEAEEQADTVSPDTTGATSSDPASDGDADPTTQTTGGPQLSEPEGNTDVAGRGIDAAPIETQGSQSDSSIGHGEPNAIEGAPQSPSSTSESVRSSGETSFYRARNTNVRPAVFARQGRGRFLDTIQWIEWIPRDEYGNGPQYNNAGNVVHNPRYVALSDTTDNGYLTTRTVVNSRNFGAAGELLTKCTLSNMVQEPRQGVTVRRGPLVATIPGSWVGDGFDNLYNDGGALGRPTTGAYYSWESPNQHTNRMVVGLSNGFVGATTGQNNRVSFDFECSAELKVGNQTRVVPIEGLVFADAEASNLYLNNTPNPTLWQVENRGEWVRATANAQVNWRLLDHIRDPSCNVPPTATQGLFSANGNNRTLTLAPNGRECGRGLGGPSAVMFMEGTHSARVALQGHGLSVVALGLIIASDYGDAPASYGHAAAIFQPRWEGGAISTAVATHDLTARANAGDFAKMVGAANGLGAVTTAEDEQKFDPDAVGDGGDTGPEADDAITNPEDLHLAGAIGGTVTRTVSCAGNGPVKGWVDWNRNGSFQEASESSTTGTCTNGSATISWVIPADVKRSVKGELGSDFNTFMRLRTAQPGETLSATGTTIGGEVEDYRVYVHVPTLELIKEVPSDSFDPGPVSVTRWELKAQQGTQTGIGYVFTGNGGVALTTAAPGMFTLSERALDNDVASAYTNGAWSCVETPGTVHPAGTAFESTFFGNTLELKNSDRVTCTVRNLPKPGSVRWSKVDEDGQTVLAGTAWTLRGPSYPQGQQVDDCVKPSQAQCSGIDKDHRPGEFEVLGLKWGAYSIEETATPVGWESIAKPLSFQLISEARREAIPEDVDGVATNGKVRNIRSTGTVTWRKTDAHQTLLGGSVWVIVTPDGTEHEVADCVSASCPAGPFTDSDSDPGEFTVGGLAWGSQPYTLREKTAPVGYVLSNDDHQFSIQKNALNYVFSTPMLNHLIAAPPLPLTGGLSADAIWLAGGLCLVCAVVAGIAGRRQRAMRPLTKR